MNAARRAGVILGCACAAVLILGAGMPARAAGGAPFQIVSSVHYGQPGNASGYSAVVALGPASAWVFGGTNPGGRGAPAAAHWDGWRWKASPLPAHLGGFIVAADASSPGNVWAAGDGYALRWNGARWSVARTWRGGQVTGVVAAGPRTAWVFGPPQMSGEAGIGAWLYDGHSWTRAGGLASSVYRASALSAADIWGITLGPGTDPVLHYDGSTWAPVPGAAAALAGVQPGDIVARSDDDVWVSGITAGGPGGSSMVVSHWDGREWTRLTAPWPALAAERFAPDGAGGIWIPAVSAGASPRTWIAHLSAAGQWQRAAVPGGAQTGIGELALIPCTQSLWGAGGRVTATGGSAVILSGNMPALPVAPALPAPPAAPEPACR